MAVVESTIEFESVHSEFEAQLMGFLRNYVHESEVDDVAQEVYIKTFQQLPALKNQERLAGWFWTIARRTVVDYYRKKRRMLPSGYSGEDVDLPTQSPGPAENIDLESMERDIHSEISALPFYPREVLNSRLIEGLSPDEVARKLRISRGSERGHLRRGKQKVGEALKKKYSIWIYASIGLIISLLASLHWYQKSDLRQTNSTRIANGSIGASLEEEPNDQIRYQEASDQNLDSRPTEEQERLGIIWSDSPEILSNGSIAFWPSASDLFDDTSNSINTLDYMEQERERTLSISVSGKSIFVSSIRNSSFTLSYVVGSEIVHKNITVEHQFGHPGVPEELMMSDMALGESVEVRLEGATGGHTSVTFVYSAEEQVLRIFFDSRLEDTHRLAEVNQAIAQNFALRFTQRDDFGKELELSGLQDVILIDTALSESDVANLLGETTRDEIVRSREATK